MISSNVVAGRVDSACEWPRHPSGRSRSWRDGKRLRIRFRRRKSSCAGVRTARSGVQNLFLPPNETRGHRKTCPASGRVVPRVGQNVLAANHPSWRRARRSSIGGRRPGAAREFLLLSAFFRKRACLPGIGQWIQASRSDGKVPFLPSCALRRGWDAGEREPDAGKPEPHSSPYRGVPSLPCAVG